MLLGLLVAGISFVCFLNGLSDGLCGNQITSQLVSPDKKLRAVVFTRDCGATTGFSTQVSVIPEGSTLPNEPGNVFIIDDNHNPAVSIAASIRWVGNRDLEIRSNKHVFRVFRKEISVSVPFEDADYLHLFRLHKAFLIRSNFEARRIRTLVNLGKDGLGL